MLLGVYTLWHLIRSSLEVAQDILTPNKKSQPKIIELTYHCKHPVQISLLVNLISLTPGTLVVDIDEKNQRLIIHVMFAQNEEQFISFILKSLEPKIQKVIEYG